MSILERELHVLGKHFKFLYVCDTCVNKFLNEKYLGGWVDTTLKIDNKISCDACKKKIEKGKVVYVWEYEESGIVTRDENGHMFRMYE